MQIFQPQQPPIITTDVEVSPRAKEPIPPIRHPMLSSAPIAPILSNLQIGSRLTSIEPRGSNKQSFGEE
ncbi:unnamed protein product, partial [Ilex paraguariensis]